MKVIRKEQVRLCLVLIAAIFAWSRQVRADYAYGCILPESSSSYMSEADTQNMTAQIACYARNEIYARNGAMFASQELQNYFNQQYWYCGTCQAGEIGDDMLNEYERANVVLLESIEEQLGWYSTDRDGYSYDPVYYYIGNYSISYTDEYAVDPYASIFYDSSSRYLSQEELAALSLQELCYARNEIFARHGMIFSSQELDNYFGQKEWYYGYIPSEEFSYDQLNEFEIANVSLLEQQEYTLSPAGYMLDQDHYSYTDIGYYIDYEEAQQEDLAQDYIFADSNSRYLTDEELSGLSLQELCYAKNEIYARRGYIFQSEELRDYFGAKEWYNGTIPSEQFSASIFNEYEAANVQLLQQYEYSISPDGYQTY